MDYLCVDCAPDDYDGLIKSPHISIQGECEKCNKQTTLQSFYSDWQEKWDDNGE